MFVIGGRNLSARLFRLCVVHEQPHYFPITRRQILSFEARKDSSVVAAIVERSGLPPFVLSLATLTRIHQIGG